MKNIKFSISLKSWKLWTVIIIFAVGIALFYISQQPARGIVKTLSLSDTTKPKKEEDSSAWDKTRQQFVEKSVKIGEAEAGKVGFGSHDGKYLSFQYPNSYYLQTKESSTSGILEKVILLGSGISSRKLAVTATKMTTVDSLGDVSAIQARRLKPEIYQEKTLDLAGEEGIQFEKKEGGFEKIAFSLQNQVLVTVALTSANKENDLDADFDFVVKELRRRF